MHVRLDVPVCLVDYALNKVGIIAPIGVLEPNVNIAEIPTTGILQHFYFYPSGSRIRPSQPSSGISAEVLALRKTKVALHSLQKALHDQNYLQELLTDIKKQNPDSIPLEVLKAQIEEMERQKETAQQVINLRTCEISLLANINDIKEAGVAALQYSNALNIERVASEHKITIEIAQASLKAMNTQIENEIRCEGLEIQMEYLKGIVRKREFPHEIAQMLLSDYHEAVAKCAEDMEKTRSDLGNAQVELGRCGVQRNTCKKNIASYDTTLGLLWRVWENTVGTSKTKEDYERDLGILEKRFNDKLKEIQDNHAICRRIQERQRTIQAHRSTIIESYRHRCQGESLETLVRNLQTKQAIIQSEKYTHTRPNISNARLQGLQEEIKIIQEVQTDKLLVDWVPTGIVSSDERVFAGRFGLLRQGSVVTSECATLIQQISNLNHSIVQFCTKFGDAVKSGVIRLYDKNSTAFINLIQHPLETLQETIRSTNERNERELIALIQRIQRGDESNITTTFEQVVPAICEHVKQKNFFECVEESTEKLCDVLIVAAFCKGAACIFEIGSAAIERTLSEGLPFQESIEMGLREVGASTVEINEFLSQASKLEERVQAGQIASRDAIRREIDQICRNIQGISLAEYDPSLGNLKKLEKAVNMFKNYPSAIDKNGPIIKLLRNGKTGSSSTGGKLATARGAAYELEKAHDLVKAGKEIIEFGKKVSGPYCTREFDIVTKTKLIECKNIDWSKKVGDVAGDMKGIIGDQLKIAEEMGKNFELHSKTKIPTDWKKWFEEKGIKYIEDEL